MRKKLITNKDSILTIFYMILISIFFYILSNTITSTTILQSD